MIQNKEVRFTAIVKLKSTFRPSADEAFIKALCEATADVRTDLLCRAVDWLIKHERSLINPIAAVLDTAQRIRRDDRAKAELTSDDVHSSQLADPDYQKSKEKLESLRQCPTGFLGRRKRSAIEERGPWR